VDTRKPTASEAKNAGMTAESLGALFLKGLNLHKRKYTLFFKLNSRGQARP
jgi:hypothetical protein